MISDKSTPIVSIGIPVRNGEELLEKAIKSALSQTLKNFEIIISDNASIDSTQQICKKYKNIDSRISYFHQKKSVNWLVNFNFVLKKAKGKYFVWLAADDFWESTFLEKNIKILNSNENIVGSISDVRLVGKITKNLKRMVTNDRGVQEKFQYVIPLKGKYDEKVKKLLKFGWVANLYSVFRTDILRKSMIEERPFASADFIIILNVLKYGDLEVLDEFIANRYTEGWTATESFIDLLKKQEVGLIGIIFPYAKFTNKCVKNLGKKIFLKNISWFFRLNLKAEKKLFLDMIKKVRNKF